MDEKNDAHWAGYQEGYRAATEARIRRDVASQSAMRLEALKIADIPNQKPEFVVARAKVFYEFLIGAEVSTNV